jgi:uncharacterized protein (DUF4415 family)
MGSAKRAIDGQKPLTDAEGEVGDLSLIEPSRFKALDDIADILPADMAKALRGRRGRPPKNDPKISLNIRLSPDVLAYFKATGRGWQTRIDLALRKAAGLKS